jgi:hypothetical protein
MNEQHIPFRIYGADNELIETCARYAGQVLGLEFSVLWCVVSKHEALEWPSSSVLLYNISNIQFNGKIFR